jgi:hypothetical protein
MKSTVSFTGLVSMNRRFIDSIIQIVEQLVEEEIVLVEFDLDYL